MNGYYLRNAERIRETARSTRIRRLEEARAYDRKRSKSRKPLPEKVRAKNAVNHAIVAGVIERKPCEVCGNPLSEGHHEDYTQPLDVLWLCRTHHMEKHRRIAA
jgi:DNA repair exonuclease SbcCD ATPase subunit